MRGCRHFYEEEQPRSLRAVEASSRGLNTYDTPTRLNNVALRLRARRAPQCADMMLAADAPFMSPDKLPSPEERNRAVLWHHAYIDYLPYFRISYALRA